MHMVSFPVNRIFAERALLPGGWAENVAISLDASGHIAAIETGSTAASGAERAAGVQGGHGCLPSRCPPGVWLAGVPDKDH